MPTDLYSTLVLLARLLLGGSFFVFGLRNIPNIGALTKAMAARGVPLPNIAAIVGVGLQIVGGALAAIGPFGVLGGAGLIAFVVLATVLFHNFWDYEGADRASHVTASIMNAGLVGAFLLVAAVSL